MTALPAAPSGVHHSLPLDSSAATLAARGSARNDQWEAYFRRRISEQHTHFMMTPNGFSTVGYSHERLHDNSDKIRR